MNKEFNFEFPTIYREFLSQIDKEGEFLIENTGVVFKDRFGRKKHYLSNRRMGTGFFLDWARR